MRKLKLFPKTFIYTIGIMSIIVVLVHSIMYIMLPHFYLEAKRDELKNLSNALVERLQVANEQDILSIAEQFAIQYNMNITLQIDGNKHHYQGFTPIDVYFDPVLGETMNDPSSQIEISTQQGKESSTPQVIVEQKMINDKDFFYLMVNIQPVDESRQVVLTLLPYSIAISFVISLIAA